MVTASVVASVHWSHVWLWRGVRSAAAMAWTTFWPLVFGLALSGVVRARGRSDVWRARLGRTTPATVAVATALGVVSSSCSYAASATARSLFRRGVSFPVAMAFMIASTNLVVELGAVIAVLLGWPFLAGAAVGGCVAIAIAVPVLARAIPPHAETALRGAGHESSTPADGSARTHPWARAARYAWGDLLMIRRELVIGFLAAGFLAADLPTSWWRDVFVSGHGWLTTVADAAIAPLVAVISCVCSVGNIPLAAALWTRGVAPAGVVAFVLADLVALPLLLIYRRFYGVRTALVLAGVLWLSATVAGLVVSPLVTALGATRTHAAASVTSGRFDLGPTVYLNIAAALTVVGAAVLVRRARADDGLAVDPVCAMAVERAHAAAHLDVGGTTYYFCSPHCADAFAAHPERFRTTATSS